MFQSLARQNAVVPAGVLETTAQRVPLRVTGALDGAKAVAETPVEANGRVFRVGDIATVTHGYCRSAGLSGPAKRQVGHRRRRRHGEGRQHPRPRPGGRRSATADFVAAVPQGFDFEQIADQPVVVDHAVTEFVHSFVEALAIVLFVSFLALGWRTGIVVALSVPLVLAVVFMVMNAMGLDLHRITLGALIIALGLLVDDAIIAVEMMVVKMEQGWDRVRAASFAWESTAFPMLTGTLVTAAGFLPIGFANSSVGEYAGGIFWVVAIALLASWVVAVMFTPYIGVKLLPNIKQLEPGHDPHEIYETRMYRGLRRVIEWCVNWRVTVVLVTVGVFVLSIVAFGRVQQQFFPLSERPELFFQLRMPAGTAFGTTLESVKKAEALLEGRLRTSPPTPLMSAAARRASGSASIRSCRTNRSPRSWSCPRTSRRASASRRGSKRRSPTARCRQRGCASTASISGRRSASRCSSASSDPIPTRSGTSPIRCAR